jgi:hypothetical protein
MYTYTLAEMQNFLNAIIAYSCSSPTCVVAIGSCYSYI